ncbi:hypothetical protein AC578_10174 [Pseudocercospora eumusae]|uniref:BTB domain-containing protein n=1 Tax=Pseudocercospora eumusae TaxID=321146 RepID=A0A139HZ39_9PEZI|nr:hypothetical protein AC578_10174 [Pseudocercospora eumusae]
MALNTAALYNQPEYSDVTIRFSNREVFCHKVILCTSSEYFKKLCGPGSHFAESQQKCIELKGDHPDALEAILEYLYTKQHDHGRDDDWALQLEIGKTAEKYLLPDLATAANRKYVSHASATVEPQAVFDTIMHIREHAFSDKDLKVADDLETKHLLALMKVNDFRQLISKDQTRMWKYLDQFTNFISDKEAVTLCKCQKCSGAEVLNSNAPPLLLGFQSHSSAGYICSQAYQTCDVWINKAERAKLQQLYYPKRA